MWARLQQADENVSVSFKHFKSELFLCVCVFIIANHHTSYRQYPGWTLTSAGSLFMAAVNDDASGAYTCTPYNSYGTMGSSGPTDVILKVSARAQLSQYRNCMLLKGQLCPQSCISLQHITPCNYKKSSSGCWECDSACVHTHCACVLIRHNRICRNKLAT